jgi:hypothetical protein
VLSAAAGFVSSMVSYSSLKRLSQRRPSGAMYVQRPPSRSHTSRFTSAAGSRVFRTGGAGRLAFREGGTAQEGAA